MGSLKLRTAILLWSALIAAAAFGASGAMAAEGSTPKKTPVKVAAKAPALCTLGQKSDGGDRVHAESVLRPHCLCGVRADDPVWYRCDGYGDGERCVSCRDPVLLRRRRQGEAIGIRIFGDTPKSVYSQGYQSDVSETVGLSCNAPGNPPATGPLTISGLGDEAFSWDPCPGTQGDYLNVIAIKGSTYYDITVRSRTRTRRSRI